MAEPATPAFKTEANSASRLMLGALPPADPGVVREYLLRSLFSRVKPLLIANIGSAILLTLLMIGNTAIWWTVIWAVSLSSWTFMRYVLAKTYLAQPRSPSETWRWTMFFAVGSGIGGTLWGMSVFFFGGFTPEEAKLPMALLMAALSAAALAGYSKNLFAFYAFFIPALVPYGVTLVAIEANAVWIGVFFSFWMFLIAVMAHNLHQGFKEVVSHEVQRESLINRLAQARDEAENASMAKTRFLANMSHELRTPLNAIIGFADMMVQKMLGPIGNNAYEPYVENISDSGNHLLKIVEEVLDVSRLEAGRIQLDEDDVDLQDLLPKAVEAVAAHAAEDRVSLSVDVPAQVPMVRADATKLRQIVINLMSNAVKYTPEGGEIGLRACVLTDGGIEIQVRDTGIGIPADILPHVTVPFAHLENREHLEREVALKKDEGQTSNGLGLPLVKLLTQCHEGEFLLESTVGKGTTARVRLPEGRVLVGAAAHTGDQAYVSALRGRTNASPSAVAAVPDIKAA